MAPKTTPTPSERLLALVQQAHPKSTTPAGPLPEAVDGGDWKVNEAEQRKSLVRLNPKGPGGEMDVPLVERDAVARLCRAHELGHIALSPRGDIETTVPPQLIQLCEDLRINTQLQSVGFAFDVPLMAQKEAENLVAYSSKELAAAKKNIAGWKATKAGSFTEEQREKNIAALRARQEKALQQMLGILTATQGTADHEELLKHLQRFSSEALPGEQLAAMSDVIAERYFGEQEMLDDFQQSTMQAAAEIEDRVRWLLDQPDTPYPGDPEPGPGDEQAQGEGESQGGGAGSESGEQESDEGKSQEDSEGQPDEAKPAESGKEGKPAELKLEASKPAEAEKPKRGLPAPSPFKAPASTGKGGKERKPWRPSKPHLPEFHGFKPKPSEGDRAPGSGFGYSFKPQSSAGDSKLMKAPAFLPGIPWKGSEGDVDEPMIDGHIKLSDLTTDEALARIIRDYGDKGQPWGTMRIVEQPRSRRLPNKVMGKRVRHSEDGLLRNPSRLASCDARVFARTRRKKGGGTLLIDQSGSMSLSLKQVEAIITAIPAATIAGYAGHSNQGTGELHILAKQGKMCEQKNMKPCGGANLVDVPALEWLAKQKEPRIWVSDGWVTGGVRGSHEELSGKCAVEAAKIIKRARIARVDDTYQLLHELGVNVGDEDEEDSY